MQEDYKHLLFTLNGFTVSIEQNSSQTSEGQEYGLGLIVVILSIIVCRAISCMDSICN